VGGPLKVGKRKRGCTFSGGEKYQKKKGMGGRSRSLNAGGGKRTGALGEAVGGTKEKGENIRQRSFIQRKGIAWAVLGQDWEGGRKKIKRGEETEEKGGEALTNIKPPFE